MKYLEDLEFSISDNKTVLDHLQSCQQIGLTSEEAKKRMRNQFEIELFAFNRPSSAKS